MGRPAKAWWRASHRCWYATIGGRKVSLGNYDREDETGANAELLRRLGKELAGELRASLPPPDPDAPPVRTGAVAALVPEYVESRRGEVSDKALANLRCMLGWLVRRFGSHQVSAVSAKAVERAAGEEEWTDGTRMMYLTAAQCFVQWCGRTRFVLAKPPAGSRGAEAVLTADEFERLVAAADGDFAPFLRFVRLTGCRPGEARQLTAGHDWSAGVVEVKEHKGKRMGKRRLVYLPPAAVAILDGQRAKYPAGPLFRNRRGRGFTLVGVGQRVRVARKKAGVRGEVVAYGLRHTFATTALEAGVPDTDVAALLGHSGTAMLHQHYSHVAANSRRLRDVAARIEAGG